MTLASSDGSLVHANIFNESGNVTAITVTASQNLEISNNSVTIVNGGGALAGPTGLTIGSATPATLSVSVLNNSFNTAGTGRGVFILTPSAGGGNVRALIQGNDFHFNLIGIADQGDNTS